MSYVLLFPLTSFIFWLAILGWAMTWLAQGSCLNTVLDSGRGLQGLSLFLTIKECLRMPLGVILSFASHWSIALISAMHSFLSSVAASFSYFRWLLFTKQHNIIWEIMKTNLSASWCCIILMAYHFSLMQKTKVEAPFVFMVFLSPVFHRWL